MKKHTSAAAAVASQAGKAGSRVEFCLKEARKRRQNIDNLPSLRFYPPAMPVKQSLITQDCFISYAREQNRNDVSKLRKGAKSQVMGSRVEFCLLF